MKWFLSALFLSVIGVVLTAPLAARADDGPAKSEIDALMKESRQMDLEQVQLTQVKQSLKTEEQGIIRRDQTNKVQLGVLVREKTRLDLEKGSYEKAARDYNEYCHGTFIGEEYRRRKAWCDANMPPLVKRKHDLQQGYQTLFVNGRTWQAERNAISRDTLNNFAQQKANDVKFQDLAGRRASWYLRYADLNNRAKKQVARIAKTSTVCALDPNIGKFSPNLNSASERAVRCLMRLWDGAK